MEFYKLLLQVTLWPWISEGIFFLNQTLFNRQPVYFCVTSIIHPYGFPEKLYTQEYSSKVRLLVVMKIVVSLLVIANT